MPALLNARHEAFCQEYLIDLNATQAAIRAGFALRSARVTASRLLTKANIEDRIAELQKERSERTGITADRVLERYAEIAFGKGLGEFCEMKDGVLQFKKADVPEDRLFLIAEMIPTEHGTRIRLYSIMDALGKLGEHLGMFRGGDKQATEQGMKPPPRVVYREQDARIRQPEDSALSDPDD